MPFKKNHPGCPCCDVEQDYHLYYDGNLFPRSTTIAAWDSIFNTDPGFDVLIPGSQEVSVWASDLDAIWLLGTQSVHRQSYAGQNTIASTNISAASAVDMVRQGWGFCSDSGAGWANPPTSWFLSDSMFLVDATPSVILDNATKTNRSFNLGANLVYNPAQPEWFAGNLYRNEMTSFCQQSYPKAGFLKLTGSQDQFTIWLDDITIQEAGAGEWLVRLPTSRHTTGVFSGAININDARLWCDYDRTKDDYYWVAGGRQAGGLWNWSVKLPWKTADEELLGPSGVDHYPCVLCDNRGDVVALYFENDNDRRLRFQSADGNRSFNLAVAKEYNFGFYAIMQSENWVYVFDIATDDVTGLDYNGPNTTWWRISKNTYAVEGGPNQGSNCPFPGRTYPVQVNGKGY